MKLNLKKRSSRRFSIRLKNKARIRKKVEGSTERPRLCLFRSHRHIYAQIIDDSTQKTLASASSLKMGVNNASREVAKKVGKEVAEKAKKKKIKSVVFDRGGYVYHGRVQALAEGAREEGLDF